MSVDFRPNNPASNDDYVNLANGNAAHILDCLGLSTELSGECRADTFVYLCNRKLDRIFAGTPGYTREDREDVLYVVERIAALRQMAYWAYGRDEGAVIHWS